MYYIKDGRKRESINALSLSGKALFTGSHLHSLPEHYQQA
jgi:hypothetical protein